MSKITFRADDDLVERLEALDTSKSEAMREALRTYLDGADRDVSEQHEDLTDEAGDGSAEDVASNESEGTVDAFIRERVDDLLEERIDELLADRLPRQPPAHDFNVNLRLDGVRAADAATDEASSRTQTSIPTDESERKTRPADAADDVGSKPCEKCGEDVSADHVYCPNCGEKASHRVFCECGDELRSDWAFCPGCGRRTSAADVLERT
ncbi:double zinc ribbon domain-containing protein [Halobellus rufus]|uniref:double zinc ribbon domain-containing protein n=1 Tax=Halobellus rufus TaxID=1448860 RepID=UPI000678DBD0|nr:zinc ribbon domain-containing protein [Halobellus rufus]